MDDAHFMKKALGEAEKALKKGEFPVGCVMVHEEKIVASVEEEAPISTDLFLILTIGINL